MKLSMWLIGERMEKYHPKFDIQDGSACITGVRFLTMDTSSPLEPQYVYLRVSGQDTGSVLLTNGRDKIVLEKRDINEILNDLLGVFDHYNAWEQLLRDASTAKSPQQIVDFSYPVLGNPIMVADMEGHILARSSAFAAEPVTEYWREAGETGRLPSIVVGSPLRTIDGRLGAWSETPQIHRTFDDMKAIGMQLCVCGEPRAVLVMLEYRTVFTQSDLCLIKALCDVLSSTLSPQKESAMQRSTSAVIEELLSGYQIDGALIDNLELKHWKPWRLIVIDNPFRKDMVNKQNLVQRLQNSVIPCVPLLFDGYVVVLVSGSRSSDLLNTVLSSQEKQYYQAALSLPYSDLHDTLTQYTFALSVLRQANGISGTFPGEDHAMAYLLSIAGEQTVIRQFIHPSLRVLKEQDEQKNSLLYETLYQYLLHERSIQHGADAMHVHKNTFLYRLQRIRELTGVDLDDPMTRAYLLMSYFLDEP